MTRRQAWATLAALLAGWPAYASELTVADAWARPTPPGARVAAVYLRIDNAGAKSDRLLKLKTAVAAGAEVHRTELIEGVARMREVSVLHLAPGERLAFEPGGLHVMLMGLKAPLAEGERFELEMLFEVAGPRKVRVNVRR